MKIAWPRDPQPSAPAAGGVVGVGGLAAGEEEEARAVVRAGDEGGVGLVNLDAGAKALGLGGAGRGHALVQRQPQEALRVFHLTQNARHPVRHQVYHLPGAHSLLTLRRCGTGTLQV